MTQAVDTGSAGETAGLLTCHHAGFKVGIYRNQRHPTIGSIQITGCRCLIQIAAYTSLHHIIGVNHIQGLEQTFIRKIHGMVIVKTGHIEAIFQ